MSNPMGQEWGIGVYITPGMWNTQGGVLLEYVKVCGHQMHRNLSGKDEGLPGFLCAM